MEPLPIEVLSQLHSVTSDQGQGQLVLFVAGMTPMAQVTSQELADRYMLLYQFEHLGLLLFDCVKRHLI
jgi:hypothetical protein